ncbi:MAG TPA: HAMP domain-containing histidine kinase [Candidatus Amulumruptor caecigallinarius]|uniref:histidine kinase n=1 Tax=Candidatus Amulumruptor caecigallinarius TaxID=2109911 RepID=A0A921E910_9BACT|nr:HAMP domain-containing histidine kinase [Candidatus Amulumruptor caecigallinarius]
MNFPWPRRLFPVSFILISMTVVSYFLYYSGTLVDELAVQERARMQIWADATRQIINTDDTVSSPATLEFLLSIIEDNRTIPLLLTDDEGTIIMQRNFALPQPIDSLAPWELSDANKRYLQSKLDRLRQSPNVIHIDISEGNVQHLYYEDSRLLKTLNIYPYILVLVMVIFIAIIYLALRASKKAEQNRLWVGLSKETAHQLGTPISSLMAWLPLLEAEGVDHDTVKEMDKDVNRLSTIASRFSKIGSKPNMEPSDLNAVVGQSVDYMKSRISRRITLTFMQSSVPINANLSAPLLEWVMENLIKNAVDAMDGQGSITVEVKSTTDNAIIMVSDTGKGMTRKQRRDIFKPGYSTKKRGWGLGLTLVRRIVTQYHGGKIYVSDSQPGIGTTFVIELPLNPALSTTDA